MSEVMIKKLSKINSITTINVMVYIVASLICFILIHLSCLCQFLYDFGVGALASLVIAFSTDFCTTKITKRQDKRSFSRLIERSKTLCSDLIATVNTAVYESIGYDIVDKFTFSEWVEHLFDFTNNEEKKKEQIVFVCQDINDICTELSQLNNELVNHYNNKNITDDFINNVKKLITSCKLFNFEYKHNNYVKCKTLLISDVNNSIINLFSDLKTEFTQKYNAEDYID